MIYQDAQVPERVNEKMKREQEHLLAAYEENKAFPDYNCKLATAFFNEGNFSGAQCYVEKALEKNAQYTKALILQTRILMEQGTIQKAMDCLKATRQQQTVFPDIYFLNGLLLMLVDQQTEALHEAKNAIIVRESYIDAHALELVLYRALGWIQELSDKHAELKKSNTTMRESEWFSKGLAAYEHKHYATALFSFEVAQALGADRFVCSFNIACVYALWSNIEKTYDILSNRVVDNEDLHTAMRSDNDLADFRKSDLFKRLLP